MTASRLILTVVAVGTLVTGAGLAGPKLLAARAVPATTTATPSDRWLDGLTASHRQFFDAPSPEGGIPLVHVMNYYDTYNKAYGVADRDIDGVLTFYGASTFYGLSDAAWAKYRIGEFLGANDPATGKPATRNPWRDAPVVLGLNLPQASIEALHRRGATFILCNNALQIFAGLLATKRGLDAGTVYEDLRANILPDVNLVPAMVIAVEQAARAGLTYHRQ
jgi:hypothetical protein